MKKSKLLKSTQRTPNPIEDFVIRTEWTSTAKIMAWINEIIKERNIPLGIAEVETKLAGDRDRPDVIIYRGRVDEDIICLLEFKAPFYEPDDEEVLKEPARKKATRRKARYFAVSNFQSLFLFNTTKVNEMKPIEEQLVGRYELSQIADLNEIEHPKFRNSIYAGLEKLVLDIAQFVTGEKSEPLIEINKLLVWRLQEKVNRLARYYKGIIEDEYHKNKEFRQQLKNWFNEQLWEFNAQDIDFVKAARQTAYLLVNKIVFYNALQSKRQRQLDPLNIPEDLTKGGLLKNHLQNYFEYVLRNIDYETIYSTDFIDERAFPDNDAVVTEIKNLVKILKRYNFSSLATDIIGYIFEQLIPTEERHNLGQYFTNSYIVDLILKFCMSHEKAKILDPACGAGTFLVRAYQHKKLMNSMLHHEEILKDLWGVDIAKFPAHLSTINLAIKDLSVDKNYPMIVHDDFFNLLSSPEGLELPEKWRKVITVALGKMGKEVTYPRWFDCIVGNPPYTRQEEIPETGVEKNTLIKKALYINQQKLADISKRAGIHTYFFIHGTKFLKDGGHFGFIVSNSWLDVDYGKGLQEFFLKNYKIVTIIESKVERWFEDADINTCIVILQKCKEARERDENLVRFVYLKKRLSDLIPPLVNNWAKEKERINKIDELIKTILFHNEFYENEDLRMFPKKQMELWDEGYDAQKQKYIGSKWGKYLRAPKIYFKILEKGKDKFVPLKEIAEVRFGIKTGANDFFYMTEEDIKKWKIEKEFWMHRDEKGNWIPNYVIKSPRECKTITVKPEDLKYRVLMIHKDKKELKGTNVLKYIQSGEREGFHKRPTCASRKRWYELNQTYYPIIWQVNTRDRFVASLVSQDIFVDKMFYLVKPHDKKQSLAILLILNSTLIRLFLESDAMVMQGASTLAIYMVQDLLNSSIINALKFDKVTENMLDKIYKEMSNRMVISVFTELGASSPKEVCFDNIKPDRRELDKIIMGEILGLTEEEQLEVYRAVVDLVKSRIEKARSIEKKKKTKEGIDIELLVKNLVAQLGEDNLGKFYKEKILPKSCYEKTIPQIEGKIRIEKNLFKWRVSGTNASIECNTEIEAEYLKNFIGIGLDNIKIPNDEKYLKKILPELTALRAKIDTIIKEEVLSILSVKTQREVLHLLWQEIMKMEEQGET